jgi:hypothetical protein
MFGRGLLAVLVGGGIIYAIVGNVHVGPDADAEKPVAIACLKRAGFTVTSDVPSGSGFQSPSYGRFVQWRLDVRDGRGAPVAILYLADQSDDDYANHLKDDQKTYGDFKGETIEYRGTTVARLISQSRASTVLHCVDQATHAKIT